MVCAVCLTMFLWLDVEQTQTHYYCNKQLIEHGKVDYNILVMKNKIVCNQYV